MNKRQFKKFVRKHRQFAQAKHFVREGEGWTFSSGRYNISNDPMWYAGFIRNGSLLVGYTTTPDRYL